MDVLLLMLVGSKSSMNAGVVCFVDSIYFESRNMNRETRSWPSPPERSVYELDDRVIDEIGEKFQK